jgi:two-component system, cell cycle response regulator DivK
VGQKILVVEDNELNLKLFCDLLRAHGYEAEPVRDGREALERARAFEPDLVVMDIQMPHISGLELIEQMKADAALRRMPIMAVTAYAAKGDEERIRDAGAEGYVSKPISVMKFVAAVAALLEAAAERQEAEAAAAAEVDAGADPASGEAAEGAGAPAEESEAVADGPGPHGGGAEAPDATDPHGGEGEEAPDVDQAATPAGEPRLPEPPEEGDAPSSSSGP